MKYRVKFVAGGYRIFTEWFGDAHEAEDIYESMDAAGINVRWIETEDGDVV